MLHQAYIHLVVPGIYERGFLTLASEKNIEISLFSVCACDADQESGGESGSTLHERASDYGAQL